VRAGEDLAFGGRGSKMAGMKVYVVSCQQLFANSFSIEGVYSTRAAAEWAVKNDPNVVGDVIEEFELKGEEAMQAEESACQ
jgi:hypothetical protein